MIRHLQPLGADHDLVIDAALLEQLGIDERTPLHLSIDGGALVIRPLGAAERAARVAALAEQVMDQHDDTFRKLAQ